MVDTDKRGNGAGETEPVANNIKLGHSGNFQAGHDAARDYKSLLSQGVVLPSPGAPIPVDYPGGPSVSSRTTGPAAGDRGLPPGDVPPGDAGVPRSKVNTPPVVQGMHNDPMAGWSDLGIPGFTGANVRPVQGDGSAPGYTKLGSDPVKPNPGDENEFKRSMDQQGNTKNARSL